MESDVGGVALKGMREIRYEQYLKFQVAHYDESFHVNWVLFLQVCSFSPALHPLEGARREVRLRLLQSSG